MRIKATYHENEFIPELNGNPLTEALVFLDGAELVEKLTYRPTYLENFEQAPQNAKEFILKKLKRTHIPQPIVTEFYSTVTTLILERYATYHPISAAHRCKLNQLAEAAVDKYKAFAGVSTTAPSILVDGQSGAGKTTMIRNALSIIPQVIEHDCYKGTQFRQDQLVWLSFDLPSTSSSKALALNFFEAVDKALGRTNYHETWSKKSSNASVDSHLNAMRLIAETHHVGIVHIDEVQFMLKYPKTKDSPSLSVLEALFNKIGVPIILSTTTQGLALFDTANGENQFVDMTTTRRMLSERQFSCKLYHADSEFFNELFDALFPPQLCTGAKLPSDSFRLKFHTYSCGLPFMMVRLAHLHHETTYRRLNKAVKAKADIKTDCVESLDKTYAKQFKLIHPALESLRAGNELDYEKMMLNKGGVEKFFENAKAKERAKQVEKLSNTTKVKSRSDTTKLTQADALKANQQKKALMADFDDFLTGMDD